MKLDPAYSSTEPDRKMVFLTSKSLFVDPRWVRIYMIKLCAPVDPNEARRRLVARFGMDVAVRVLTSRHPEPSTLLEVELEDDVLWQDIIIRSTEALESLLS